MAKMGLHWLTTVKCLHAAVHSASRLEDSHIFTAEMQKQIKQAGRRLTERNGRALSCRAAAVRRWLRGENTQGSLGLDDSLNYVNVAFCHFLLTTPSRRRVTRVRYIRGLSLCVKTHRMH